MLSGVVAIAIQLANEMSAYAAQFAGSRPTGKQLVKVHKLASEARWAVDAAWDMGGLTAEDEWQLITMAAIPVETLIAVNVALLKDAKAAASTIRSLVAQAKDLPGVTKASRDSLDFVDGRAQMMLAYKGKDGDLAPNWVEVAGCPTFWDPCGPNWIVTVVVIGLLWLVAKKYRLM